MHKVFVSYHHANDQYYKESLVEFATECQIFVDASVDTGDISDELSDQSIREKIRDEYLRDSTVTILLAGSVTRRRKHVDWEIYSSMFDGPINKKSGILVIDLPSTSNGSITAPHGQNEKSLYPDITNWTSVDSRAEYERRYPHFPDRIIDNLIAPEANISVIPWGRVNSGTLGTLVDFAFTGRASSKYDLSRPMRRNDS